jgi:hypothetical protein
MQIEYIDCRRQVDLIADMYSFMVINDLKIVLAALSQKSFTAISDAKNQTIVKETKRQLQPSDRVFNQLIGIIETNVRLQVFFNNSISVICDRLRIVGDKLELLNVRIVNVHHELVPVYQSLESTQDRFVLVGFYEL